MQQETIMVDSQVTESHKNVSTCQFEKKTCANSDKKLDFLDYILLS